MSSSSPVIFARLRSQTAIDSTADRCLSSVPRLLEERPADDEEQRSANGIVCNEGHVACQLSTYGARMKAVRCHFCTCQRDILITNQCRPVVFVLLLLTKQAHVPWARLCIIHDIKVKSKSKVVDLYSASS